MEQIEEAPAPGADSKQVFENFRDATVALLECDELPTGVRAAVGEMLDQFNNELGANDEPMSVNAHRVMSTVFKLNGDDAAEDRDRRDGVEDECDCRRAANALAEAFASIEQYRDYMPAHIYNPVSEAILEWFVNDEDWLTTPRLMRAGLPGILRVMFTEDDDDE